jgi:hypothetical protein
VRESVGARVSSQKYITYVNPTAAGVVAFPKGTYLMEGITVGIDHGSAGSCRAVSIHWLPIHADSQKRTDALVHRGRGRGLTEYVELQRASSPKRWI